MASALTTSFSHVYNGQEFLQELFFQPQEGGDDIFGRYKVMQVIDKMNLYIPNNLEKILKKYSTCGFSSDGALTISDRIIQTEKVKINLEQCEDEFDDTIFEESIKRGVLIDDLRGTIIEDILRQKLMDAMVTDIPRIQWFGSDASGSDDYDHFDGWLQLGIDSSADLGQFLDMNTVAEIEVGGDLVTDGALEAFRNMYENQSKTLRAIDRSKKFFYVTSTVMDNYLTTLEDTQNEVGHLNLENGKAVVKFRGVQIIEVLGWDTHLADDDNPQKSFIGNNLIVFTMPQNLIVGSDVNSPFTEVKVRYSEDNETLRMTVKFKLGAQILHPEFMSIAF